MKNNQLIKDLLEVLEKHNLDVDHIHINPVASVEPIMSIGSALSVATTPQDNLTEMSEPPIVIKVIAKEIKKPCTGSKPKGVTVLGGNLSNSASVIVMNSKSVPKNYKKVNTDEWSE